MFRRTKHYALSTPMECLISDGDRYFSGVLVNLSLHGAFVAKQAYARLPFHVGDAIWLNTRLNRNGEHGAGTDLRFRARVIWRNVGLARAAPTLDEGLGIEFVLKEQTLRECTALISELTHRGMVVVD